VSGEKLPYRSLLVTGAGGYIGRLLVEALAREPGALVLSRSPVLNERELVEFCETGDASKQTAIAGQVYC
jgi:NAD(P)-dependent dehydrogenase (short-subunit alcohol dehydrogenase family)